MKYLTHRSPGRLGWWDEDPLAEMERFLGTPFGRRLARWDGPNGRSLPLDVLEDEDAYFVEASIPGVDPDDLEITFSEYPGKSDYGLSGFRYDILPQLKIEPGIPELACLSAGGETCDHYRIATSTAKSGRQHDGRCRHIIE